MSENLIVKRLINAFHLQWHITENCNCRCKHCYQEGYSRNSEMSFEDMVFVFLKYKDFLSYFYENHVNGEKYIPTISFTGGEPFVHKDFIKFLDVFSSNKDFFFSYILTNGTLITESIARKIKECGITQVQVSLDGDEETHDKIRGVGNFKKVLRGVEFLVGAGVRTHVSFTAHKMNWHLFPKVAQIAKEIGASYVWSDRVIPTNSDSDILSLSPSETKDYVKMLNEQFYLYYKNENDFKSARCRALQRIGYETKLPQYYCHAGIDIFTLMENGDVLACRRMPIVVGNIFKESFKEIYLNNSIMKDLRVVNQSVPEGCSDCQYANECTGGLKCLSYSVTGSYSNPNPGCWLVKDKV